MLLIIGGFDPTSKAGILADSSIATKMEIPYRCCMTTNTIQTEESFISQCPTEPNLFRDQLNALLKSVSFTGVKLGFIGDIALATIVSDLIKQYRLKNIVIDPVIVGKRADRVIVDKELIDFYMNRLFPLAEVVTPNWSESCVLTGCSSKKLFSPELMEQKCKIISDLGKCNVIISGKLTNNKILDCLIHYHTKELNWFEAKSFIFENILVGLGCRFSTAIAAHLSIGLKLNPAITAAKIKITEYLESINLTSEYQAMKEKPKPYTP